MNISLTSLQAFNAMTKFLDDHYDKTFSDDIGSILGSMQFVEDNRTADPAIWHDWLDASDKKPSLTSLEAFDGMRKFLKEYGYRISSQEVKSLLSDMQPSENAKINPIIWRHWMKYVREAINEPEGSRSYLVLYK